MINRGDIYLVNLGNDRIGSVQHGIRPAIVVQNNIGNQYSTTTLVCPLTSKVKKQMPTHTVIESNECGLNQKSVALSEQIQTIDKQQLIKKIGSITNQNLINKINHNIMVSFGL